MSGGYADSVDFKGLKRKAKQMIDKALDLDPRFAEDPQRERADLALRATGRAVRLLPFT